MATKEITRTGVIDGLSTRVQTGTVKVTVQIEKEPQSYVHLILTKDEAAGLHYGQAVSLVVEYGE